MENDLNSRTPGGTLAYSDYLMDKGYATAAQVNPWKTAIQRVFETVEGESWESVDLTSIDLDEYIARFRTLAGAQFKAESITAYARRIRNAIDAHEYYLTTGRPPSFRQRGSKPKDDGKPSDAGSVVKMQSKQGATAPASQQPVPAGMIELSFPLGDGRMLKFHTPPRLKSDDVNRICTFIRALQDDSEQRQIPRQTGEQEDKAA